MKDSESKRSNSTVLSSMLGTREGVKFSVPGDSRPPIEMKISALSNHIYQLMALHGITQRLRDAAAIPKEKNPTAADRYNAILALRDHYASGTEEWNLPRTGGGGDGLSHEGRLVWECLKRLYPASAEKPRPQFHTDSAAFKAWLDSQAGIHKTDRATIVSKYLDAKDVKPIRAAIEKERKAALPEIDEKALFAGL